MKRTRKTVILVASFLVLAGVLSGALYLWLVVTNRTFVWVSSYRVTVPDKAGVWGRLYTLPHGERLVFDAPTILPPGKHLLVLAAGIPRAYEGYYVDVKLHKIAIAGFSPDMFVPLFHSALVYDAVFEGCCPDGRLLADWSVKDGGEETHIRIKGYQAVTLLERQGIDPEEDARRTMPIGYQHEIILRK